MEPEKGMVREIGGHGRKEDRWMEDIPHIGKRTNHILCCLLAEGLRLPLPLGAMLLYISN